MNESNDWDFPEDNEEVPLNLKEMDALIVEMRAKKEEYDAAKKASSEVFKEFSSLEHKVLAALKAVGKKSYKLDGLGTFSIVHKNVITVPKGLDNKRKMFAWISQTYGDDVLDDMRSINSQKLTSFYNEEAKKEVDNPMFEIPGIDAPTIKESTSFRKG